MPVWAKRFSKVNFTCKLKVSMLGTTEKYFSIDLFKNKYQIQLRCHIQIHTFYLFIFLLDLLFVVFIVGFLLGFFLCFFVVCSGLFVLQDLPTHELFIHHHLVTLIMFCYLKLARNKNNHMHTLCIKIKEFSQIFLRYVYKYRYTQNHFKV